MTELHLTDLPTGVARSADIIAARLREAIFAGRYALGERLPAERELAEHFGASRGTVREALKRLEEQRLLVRRMGSGTFVNHEQSLESSDISDRTSPLELIEVRLALEPAICRLAALNGTARDLSKLGESIEKLEQAKDLDSFSQADEAFHLCLAEATHNPLMIHLFSFTNAVRAHEQWALMKEKILSANNIDRYNQQHRQIYEALRSRDVEAAVSAIESHLKKAREDLLGV